MKTKELIFLSCLFLITSFYLKAQDNSEESIHVFTLKFESWPKFENCKDVIDDPKTEFQNEIHGCYKQQIQKQWQRFVIPKECPTGYITRIYVTYSVDKEGRVFNVRPGGMRGDKKIQELLKKETIRVFESIPKLIPAKYHGKNVSVYGFSESVTIKN